MNVKKVEECLDYLYEAHFPYIPEIFISIPPDDRFVPKVCQFEVRYTLREVLDMDIRKFAEKVLDSEKPNMFVITYVDLAQRYLRQIPHDSKVIPTVLSPYVLYKEKGIYDRRSHAISTCLLHAIINRKNALGVKL